MGIAEDLRDSASWTKVAMTGPSARYDAAMSHDSKRNHFVLFCGSSGGVRKGDTWIYGLPIKYELNPKPQQSLMSTPGCF